MKKVPFLDLVANRDILTILESLISQDFESLVDESNENLVWILVDAKRQDSPEE